jgi:4-amino-4-deoxy-L-arabinose transferase-like glycosyltransferase
MSMSRRFRSGRVSEAAMLAAILAIAAVARLWAIRAGVPHAVGIDEPQIADRVLRIMHTGDWNPHIFDYPTLSVYLYTIVAIVRFLVGATRGEWSSLDAFDVAAVYGAGRIVAALIGVATVGLTYLLGRRLASRRVAAIGALLFAVFPMHVRESHFMLTDVPVTALMTLTLWLSACAAEQRRASTYAAAGAAGGLAAAAKYNGVVACVAVLITWLLNERRSAQRWRILGAAAAGAAVAFVLACPYALLDLPAFLDGFAGQLSRFSTPSGHGDPSWLLYLKHLALSGRMWLPLAGAGILIVLARRPDRTRWGGVVAFTFAYYYTLSTHSHVFGRYALPLGPPLCLLAAVTIDAIAAWARRWPLFSKPWPEGALAGALTLVVLVPFTQQTIGWLDQQRKPDTRLLAAAWMKQSLPRAASIAVETSGPTYLQTEGFRVREVEQLFAHPASWYRGQVDYLVISSADRDRYAEYLAAGTTVYQIAPTPQRWGPPIVVVKLR